jgi:hypothetical protein
MAELYYNSFQNILKIKNLKNIFFIIYIISKILYSIQINNLIVFRKNNKILWRLINLLN